MGINATQLKKPGEFTKKQIIIVRRDIKMSRGKLAAQVAHASVLAVVDAIEHRKDWFMEWIDQGFPKIVLKAEGVDDLWGVYAEAVKAGLPAAIVADFGLTELPEGTITAVAVGPAPVELVDAIGRKFKLL